MYRHKKEGGIIYSQSKNKETAAALLSSKEPGENADVCKVRSF